MHIEIRSIDQITPYDQNPRLRNGAVEAVARSLREFKVRQPIVVDKDGVIVVGHTRWKAAKLLGWTEFPEHAAGAFACTMAPLNALGSHSVHRRAHLTRESSPLRLSRGGRRA